MDGKALVRLFERMAGGRGTFETYWQEVADYVLPSRVFNRKPSPGERRNQKIVDSTAPWANEQFASGMHGYLTSPTLKWFTLETEDEALNQDDDVVFWLEDCVRRMYMVYNSPEYGFNPNSHELYLDIGAFGTGVMFIAERPGSILFQTRPLGECYIDENAEGRVDTLFRKFEYSARQAVEKFGLDVLSSDIQKCYEKEPERKFTFLHAVYPRQFYDPRKETKGNMKWASCYLEYEKKNKVLEGGFREFPFTVPRWMRRSGELYGHGPSMTLLPDIKMVNEMMKTTLKSAQKIVDPPLMLPDDGFMRPIRTTPGALNYYRSGAPQYDRIQPLETRGRPDIGIEMIQGIRQAIIRGYFVDWMNMPEEKHEGNRVAASWVHQRRQEKMRLIAPMLSRMQSEHLGPLIERTFAIMMRQGAFLPPPPQLSGVKLRIDYVSPVAKAQRAQELEGVFELFGMIEPLAAYEPNVGKVIKGEETLRHAGQILGVPSKLLRTRAEMVELAQQQEEVDNEAQLKQNMGDLAMIQKTVSEAERNNAEIAQTKAAPTSK